MSPERSTKPTDRFKRWVQNNPGFKDVLHSTAAAFYAAEGVDERRKIIHDTTMPALNDAATKHKYKMRFSPQDSESYTVSRQIIVFYFHTLMEIAANQQLVWQ